MRKVNFSIPLDGEQCSGLSALVAKGQVVVTLKKLADQVSATVAFVLTVGMALQQLG